MSSSSTMEVPPVAKKIAKKCPHGKNKYYCKACGGKGICMHGKHKRICGYFECGGGSALCSHGDQKHQCLQCHPEKRKDPPPGDFTWKVGDKVKASLAASFARAGWDEDEGLECNPSKRKETPQTETWKVGDKVKESLAASFARAGW